MKQKILVFAGSTRQGSFNGRLADTVTRQLREQDVEVTRLNLADYPLPLYNADLEREGTPVQSLQLKQLFHEHAGWVICSPEYNGSYTGLLKNTIDWVSSPVKGDPQWQDALKPFAGKVVGLLSASPGQLGGLRSLDPLMLLLANLQCWVTPARYALAQAHEAWDAQGQWLRERDANGVRAVLEQVIWGSQKLPR